MDLLSKIVFFFLHLFILAVLGLRCCVGFSLIADSGSYSLIAMRGLLKKNPVEWIFFKSETNVFVKYLLIQSFFFSFSLIMTQTGFLRLTDAWIPGINLAQ